MKLTPLAASEEGVCPPPSSPLPSPLPSPPPSGGKTEKILTLCPDGDLPSILAPKGGLGCVTLRVAGSCSQWSKPYPLPYEEGWNKPQLLVEVTFASLFCVCNHLPLDLTVMAVPTAPGQGDHTPSSGHTPSTETCVVPGNGRLQVLTSLHANTCYNLRFRISDTLAVSEPPVSLSTDLLREMPFSPQPPPHSPISTSFTLPLSPHHQPPPHSTPPTVTPPDASKPRGSKVQADLTRSDLNTIVLDLRPEYAIMNATSMTFDLVEPTVGGAEDEGCVQELAPSVTRLTCNNEIVLKAEHLDTILVSNLVTFPTAADGSSRASGEDRALPCSMVALSPVPSVVQSSVQPSNKDSPVVVVGKAVVSYQLHHSSSLTATIKPAFILQNNSRYSVRVLTCITEKGVLLPSLSHQLSLLQSKLTECEIIEPRKCQALLFWNLLSSSLTGKGATHSLLITGCDYDCPSSAVSWSIHLSVDFVRHSFSLPVTLPSQSFAACLLTMHESADVTYLVLQEDMAPRVCLQNLTSAEFEVAESRVTGINACPQSVPSRHEVVYEPPSMAKLYPLVYDDDIATEHDRRIRQAATNLRIKIRCVKLADGGGTAGGSKNVEAGGGESGSWSDHFLLAQDQDRTLEVPGFGCVLVSCDSQAHRMFLSLLPTGPNPCQKLTSRLGVMSTQTSRRTWRLEVELAQLVASLCDDTHSHQRTTEISRFVANGLHFVQSSLDQEEGKLDLTLQSLRVDNMLKKSSEDFSVVFLPRCEHAAPQQLIKQETPPLLKLLIRHNPHAVFQISSIHVSIQPGTFQLEDSLLQKFRSIMETFKQPQLMHVDPHPALVLPVSFSSVPLSVLHESERDAYPVTISSLVVEPVAIYVSVNITLRAYLSCKDTPFGFNRYELVRVFSNWPEVSQIVAARYMSALFMHVGWVLGSLELIGNPVAFIQSVNRGLTDLVSLPYEGLTRSPGLFILGIGQGTASFVRQFSSGALTSVTNLASSIARNMERLSMDPDHMTYQDQRRRERPATRFTEGVAYGVSSFGLSLMSAVAGLVEQPMQSFQHMEESAGTTTTLLKGVGKGLLGVVTKPVGGAMDLVSRAGQGIMHGSGLVQKLEHCQLSEAMLESIRIPERKLLLKTRAGYSRKLGGGATVMSSCVCGLLSETGPRQASMLLLTPSHLYLWDTVSDTSLQVLSIETCSVSVSPGSTDGEVKLHIMACSVADQRPERDRDFEIVRQYLEKSSIALQQGPGQDQLVPGQEQSVLDTAEDISEARVGINNVAVGEGPGGVVLCVDSWEGMQFMAVYESFKQLSWASLHTLHKPTVVTSNKQNKFHL